MKIGIIGTGVYSVSIALTLASNKDNEIVMWSENEKLVAEHNKTKKLDAIFKDKTIPKNIILTNSYEETLDSSDVVFLMTSVDYLESVCKTIRPIIKSNVPVCIGTKGIAKESNKLIHEIAKKHLKNKISILSGPTFAIDVANLEPIGFSLASKHKKSLKKIKSVFNFEDVRIDESNDLTGLAICGCVKNIYAIGSGIISGLGFNESTKAVYLTSVYEELGNILYSYKSSLETLNSLAGFGDLTLTCSSNKSRNFTYGEMIGKKASKKDIKKFTEDNTIEGINTLNQLYPILKKKHVKCPIMTCIYSIINEDENPKNIIKTIIKND